MVGHAGGMLLTRTAVVTGLTAALSQALARWRKPFATHDPGKIVPIWRSLWPWEAIAWRM